MKHDFDKRFPLAMKHFNMKCTRHRANRKRRLPGAWAPMSLSLLWDVERPKPHTIGSSGGSHLGKWWKKSLLKSIFPKSKNK